MPRRKRTTLDKQARARQQAVDHETDKDHHFRGRAKVALEHLAFDTVRERADDPRNQRFLVEAFRRNGCVPLDPTFHVPALINDADLQLAMGTAQVVSTSLLTRNAAQLPRLRFPSHFRLQCLSGKHRVAAAQECLPPAEQWWIVELYSNGESLVFPVFFIPASCLQFDPGRARPSSATPADP